MKKYEVVIHYEGGWFFEVEAENEDEAKRIAEEQFNELPSEELVANLADAFVDDCWEMEK